ncbi:MAG: hypothetical protein EBY39_03015 [Flavobacteriia bacterium]|nr:hypothetical protein [Flavobacteriia bacterium]
MNEYKYKASFEIEVVASAAPVAPEQISQASLDNLKPLVPSDINLNRNIDLLGVAFNAAVVNRFNKNGDGIDSSTAVSIKDFFIHKPTNIEHKRDQVVGHIVSSGFSSFGDSQIMSDEQALSTKDPYNISLAAVVYKNASPEFSNMLESSETEDGELSTVVSTSWELGFNEFAVAIGSKDLKECEVVYGQEAEELKDNLVSFGGTGKLEDGRTVHRLVIGEVFPLGVAFTTKPAADVKGVVVVEQDDAEKTNTLSNDAFLNKIKNKSSHTDKNNVIQNKENILDNMDTEKLITGLESLLEEKRRANDFSEEAVASITKLVNDVIIEKSSEWKSQVEEAESKAQELESAQAEIAEKYDALNVEFKNAQEKLEQIQKENAERDFQDAFNARMESLSNEYDLSEDDLKIIASELNSVDIADEAFAEYKEKFAKIWAHKNKEFIQKQAEELEAKIAEEVQKRLGENQPEDSAEVVDAALENLEESQEAIPNNNSESVEEESLTEKFEKAFSAENVSIKY